MHAISYIEALIINVYGLNGAWVAGEDEGAGVRKGSLLVKVAKDVQYSCPMNCANKLTGQTANAMSGIRKEQRAQTSSLLLNDIGQDHYDTFPVDPPRAQDILKAIGSAQINHVMNNGEATKSYFVFKKVLDYEEWRTPTIKPQKYSVASLAIMLITRWHSSQLSGKLQWVVVGKWPYIKICD